MTLLSYGEALRTHAIHKPDSDGITDNKGTISWREAERLCDIAASRLLAEGIREGDVVAVTGPSESKLLLAVFAIWRIGAIPLHLNTRKSAEEMLGLLELGEPRLLVGYTNGGYSAPTLSVVELFEGPSPETAVPNQVPQWFRVAPSGGSTGRSKLIVVASPAVIDPLRPWLPAMKPNGIQVLPLDIMDGTGFVAATSGLATGSHIVLLPNCGAEALLQAIEHYKADWLAVTQPQMLSPAKLDDTVRERYSVASLEAVCQFSGAAAPWLKRFWIDWLGPERVFEIYGATDARYSVDIRGDEWLNHPGSVGKPDPDALAILDSEGRPLPNGQLGSIYMRDLSGQRNFFYLGQEVETLEGGWETVGDEGYIDDEGYLFIADRRKDLIQTAHGVVIPNRLEGEIERHPDVLSALVVGLPGSGGQVQVHAIVHSRSGALDLKALRAYLESCLPAHMLPTQLELVDCPLRDVAGKARRAEFKAARAAS